MSLWDEEARVVRIEDLKGFQEKDYARNLVLKTENVEIILVCWMPGQTSPMHGHGKTDGIVMVMEGEMFNTNLYPDGRRISGTFGAGNVCHTPVGVLHEMGNRSQQKAVTFHIYAPPLAPEYVRADLGYNNDTHVQEIKLTDDEVKFLIGSLPGGLPPEALSHFSI